MAQLTIFSMFLCSAWDGCLRHLNSCGTFGIYLSDLLTTTYWSAHSTGKLFGKWNYKDGTVIEGKVKSKNCPQTADGNTLA